MKFCDDHWAQLKAAINNRGLGQFTAKNGKDIMSRVVSQLEGKDDEESFEPLLEAYARINGQALEILGPGLLMHEGCPMCTLIQGCSCGKGAECGFLEWIDSAAEEQLRHARAIGVAPGQN